MSLDKKLKQDGDDWIPETFKEVDENIIGSLAGKGLGLCVLGGGCELVGFSLLSHGAYAGYASIPIVLGAVCATYGASRIYRAYKWSQPSDSKKK